MKQEDVLYGLDHWETLEHDLDMVIERVMEDACDTVGDSFEVMADRITWPIKVLVYKRRDIGGDKQAQRIADQAISEALDNLDEEYSGEWADPAEPTEAIKVAALAFGQAVVADYVPWSCEPTGEVIEYTREQVKGLEESS